MPSLMFPGARASCSLLLGLLACFMTLSTVPLFADSQCGGGDCPWYADGGAIEVDDDPVFRRGDTDGSGSVDLSDAVSILVFLFLGSNEPDCRDAADSNDSGSIDLSDAVEVLDYLFIGGRPPAPPGPSICGSDGEGTSLGCESYSSSE